MDGLKPTDASHYLTLLFNLLELTVATTTLAAFNKEVFTGKIHAVRGYRRPICA